MSLWGIWDLCMIFNSVICVLCCYLSRVMLYFLHFIDHFLNVNVFEWWKWCSITIKLQDQRILHDHIHAPVPFIWLSWHICAGLFGHMICSISVWFPSSSTMSHIWPRGPCSVPYSQPSADPSDLPVGPQPLQTWGIQSRPQGTGTSVWNTQQDHWDLLWARLAELVKAIMVLRRMLRPYCIVVSG